MIAPRMTMRKLLLVVPMLFVFSLTGCNIHFGTLVVAGDMTLTGGVIGNVEIAADGVTLNCDNYVIIDAGLISNCRNGNRSCGIRVENRNDVTLLNCDVREFDDGFWISNSNNVEVHSSIASLNSIGYRIDDSSHVDVVQSTAISNLGEGFAVRNTNGIFFWSSAAVQNGGDGFDENDGSNAYYLRNDSFNNGTNGHELDFGSNPIYWENWVYANGQHGISLDAVDSPHLHANEIVVSGEDGMRLDDELGQGTINGLVDDNYSSGNGDRAAHQCGNLCTGNVYNGNWFVGPLNNIP